MEIVPKETREPTVCEQYEGLEKFLTKEAQKLRPLARAPARADKKRRFLAALDETFELIGGVPRLAVWADKNLTDFYKLYGKSLPAQIQATIDGKMQHIIRPALPPNALDGEVIDVTPDAPQKS